MRILLDECLDVRWRHLLPGHEVETVQFRGWKGFQNGKLLAVAEIHFDVFITLDKNLPSQQDLENHQIKLIVLQIEDFSRDKIAHLFSRINLLLAADGAGIGKLTLLPQNPL